MSALPGQLALFSHSTRRQIASASSFVTSTRVEPVSAMRGKLFFPAGLRDQGP
jgi:hypothetical protein